MYELKLVVDTTNFAGIDGDDAWEFPAEMSTPGLEVNSSFGSTFIIQGSESGPYLKVETAVQEFMEEWRNLVMNNQFIGQKIEITLSVRVLES